MRKSEDGLPKYVVNWDELTQPLKEELLKIVSEALHDKYPQVNTHNLKSILEALRDLLPSNYYHDLQHKIDEFVYKKVKGIQKVDGAYLDIPPIIKETQYDFKFDKDVFLTGFHVDQTGWKSEDRYNLVVDKRNLIKNAATKEIGEHKYFNTFFKVNANTPISFILENNSGNSRETAIDLEYIEGETITLEPPPPPPPDPSTPSVINITNPWDVAVEMNWEIGSADIDLHGFIDGNHNWDNDNHVWYHHKKNKDETLVLNFDFRDHLNNTYPEILSVKGHDVLDVYIHNWNPTQLNNPVHIKIYTNNSTGIKVIKEYDINLSTDKKCIIGVCSINLNTLVVTDRTDKIPFIAP